MRTTRASPLSRPASIELHVDYSRTCDSPLLSPTRKPNVEWCKAFLLGSAGACAWRLDGTRRQPARCRATSKARRMAAEQTLAELRVAESGCTRCPLYRLATQVVPGAGSSRARLMLVGEQPGDKEDLAGKPFVGPAGRILNEALDAAGIERSD